LPEAASEGRGQLTKSGVLVIVYLAAAAWLAWVALRASRRLRDRSPALQADHEGLRFHPAIGPAFTPWADVKSIRHVTQGRGSSRFSIVLAKPFWSPTNLGLAGRVTLYFGSVGLSYRQGEGIVRAMNAARKAQAGKP
jgi:hypothetical protein